MPGPHSPEAMKSLALTRLDWAYSLRHGAHALGLRAARPEPHLDPGLAQQQAAILKLASALVEKQFEEEMDQLASCWLEFRKAEESSI